MMSPMLFWLVTLCLLVQPAVAATVTDADGRTVEVTKPFSRIVSLYAAHTENLFSLGLDREVIGVDRSSDHPAEKLGSTPRYSYREDPERLIGARPDLVLVRPMISRGYPDFVTALERAGITVLSFQPNTIDQMFSYWRDLGTLTGRAAAAEAMIARFQSELAAIRAGLPAGPRPRVYFEAIHAKMKTFTPGSMAIFCLEAAGGINVAADARAVRNTNIAAYGKERILAHGAEIDVFLAQRGRMNRVQRKDILDEPGFQAIRAVREGRVFLVDEHLVSRPTLRLLDGIREIARCIHQP